VVKGKRFVGIFDSGVGGLTVLKEIVALLPQEHIIYLGDTARVPYGTRSPKTVIKYSRENVRFLRRWELKVLVVACNTSSSVSLPTLKEENEIPVVGVIEPGVRRAVEVTRTGRIGVIGTEGTIRSGAYQRRIREMDPHLQVFATPCPLFVPLVEEGWIDDPISRLVAHRYLRPLKEEGIDVLILGCTHYPLLEGVIREVMGEGIELINSAKETAREVKRQLERGGMLEPPGAEGERKFFVTDNPGKFTEIGKRFLGVRIDRVEEVEL